MRSLLLTLLLAGTLFASNAKEDAALLGAENNFSTALEKAKKEKKILVMVIVKENCRWCDRLVKRTLLEPEVKTTLKNYVTLVVDRNDAYPNLFNEDMFPSIFYIDPLREKSIYSNVGYVGKKCFLNDLNQSQSMLNELYSPN